MKHPPLRFYIPIAQKQKQKTTWVLDTWCKQLGVKFPVAALLIYHHLILGRVRGLRGCTVHGPC